jgi:glutaredoxin
MKKYYKLSFLLLLTLISSCDYCKKTYNNLFTTEKSTKVKSVLIDGTGIDPNQQDISQYVVDMLDFNNENAHKAVIVRTGTISETDEPIEQYAVSGVPYALMEEVDRIEKLKQYKIQVEEAIKRSYQHLTEKHRYSRIVETLSSEINFISKIESDEPKEVYVVSDLFQSSSFSYYRSADFVLAQRNPNAIAARYQEIAPLPPDISNVTVHLIYHPENYEAQERYTVALRVMKLWLESHGVTVISETNLATTAQLK